MTKIPPSEVWEKLVACIHDRKYHTGMENVMYSKKTDQEPIPIGKVHCCTQRSQDRECISHACDLLVKDQGYENSRGWRSLGQQPYGSAMERNR